MNFLEEKIISDGVIKESIAIIDDMDFETQTIHFRDNK